MRSVGPLVLVHGGVDSPGRPKVLRGLQEAARVGLEALAAGKDALAAVEVAVRVLESDPHFNAGLGSVLNQDGEVETDASVADGSAGRFAGVAALRRIMHPITVAAELLRRSPGPVLLAGPGAQRFARYLGAPERDLRTTEQVRIWEEVRRGQDRARSPFTGRPVPASDTVGAVALDTRGRLAAGSSTGGILLKMPGRVGDAAIFGAGIYVDERVAVLCSGVGEAAIELCLAFRAAQRYRKEGGLERAVIEAVELVSRRSAVGGILLLDAEGERVVVAHNAADFPVVADAGEGPEVLPSVKVEGGDG